MRLYRTNVHLQALEKEQITHMCSDLGITHSAAVRSAVFHFRGQMRTLEDSLLFNRVPIDVYWNKRRHAWHHPKERNRSEHITVNFDDWEVFTAIKLAKDYGLSLSGMLRVGLMLMVTTYWCWEEVIELSTQGTSINRDRHKPNLSL